MNCLCITRNIFIFVVVFFNVSSFPGYAMDSQTNNRFPVILSKNSHKYISYMKYMWRNTQSITLAIQPYNYLIEHNNNEPERKKRNCSHCFSNNFESTSVQNFFSYFFLAGVVIAYINRFVVLVYKLSLCDRKKVNQQETGIKVLENL